MGVLVVHGVGSQQPGYSTELRVDVDRRLGALGERLAWQEVHWAPVLQDRERSLEAAMRGARQPDGSPVRLDWQVSRSFVVHNVGDALAYHRDAHPTSAYAAVHRCVSDGVTALKAALDDRRAPVVVMAHSLGAHIMSNYLWDRQHPSRRRSDPLEPVPTLTAMITFGATIPLFSLSFEVARPIVLPGRAVRRPALRAAAAWLNFLDRDDVLGWPLKPLYERHLSRLTKAQRRTVDKIADHEIGVGGLGSSWNPRSHNCYWSDDSFTRPVAAYLERLLTLV
jgi:hypothetical protein